MDIALLSTAMSQSNVQESAGIALIKKAMDVGKENAAQMTEMMVNVSTDPNLGNNIDVRV